MELKYKKSEQTTATYTSSNRTFMELKFGYAVQLAATQEKF